MTTLPMFHGFDGLLALSRREGVDIRPTLLRVLTDLYVQTSRHTHDEERQFTELALRLIDEVDDATLAAVRARLSVYPATPREVARKLKLKRETGDPRTTDTIGPDPIAETVAQPEAPAARPLTPPPVMSMQPDDAAKLIEMFLSADSRHRAQILHGLTDTPLKPSTPVDPRRAERAIRTLEEAAMARDINRFIAEFADALLLTSRVATQITTEPGGEPLACALKALGMPAESYQRVLLFLNPATGSAVTEVYRLARLYGAIDPRAALIMLAAWRGSAVAAMRAKYRPALYDDERQHVRSASAQPRTAVPSGIPVITRKTTRG